MDRATAISGLDVIASGETWCVARNAHVLVIFLSGPITDEIASSWQAASQSNLDHLGHPTFGVVVALDVESKTSLGNRVKTAAFARLCAKAMKRLVMITDVHAGIVINTVMRVAQVDNVHFIDESQGVRVLSALRAGVDPFAEPSS